ncbi:solute carrier family 23 member 1-like isoform X2 [Mizuhopecten yessoensis]|uniref:Solute carrier family 23 member 2 n=1 Tax=Mizuhopecten yessoensis TaxID=6573 RepID=A0A210QD66_MIZYE|nr:solute carrier family 23 member 1-like isoform X2 [Mizuhopecten yessoensis]OWF46668.1 Solute carrier family 23 member 2 [Mizuhopecten yessoensis]
MEAIDKLEENEEALLGELGELSVKNKSHVNGQSDRGRRRVSYASDTDQTPSKDFDPPSNEVTVENDTEQPFLYTVSETPPVHTLLLIGFQHALLSLSGSLAIVLIAADVICAKEDAELTSQMLSSTLFVNGVSTILMVTIGARLPLYQGAYGGYIIPLLALLQIDPNRCSIKRPSLQNSTIGFNSTISPIPFNEEQAQKDLVLSYFAEIQGCLMIVGTIHFLVGATGLVGVLLRYVGPITIVPSILLLGIYVAEPVLTFVAPHWGMALLTSSIGFILAFYLANWKMPIPIWTRAKGCHIIRYPFHQIYAILIAITISWLVSLIITEAGGFTDDPKNKGYLARTDARLGTITSAKWFFFPYPGLHGSPAFSSTVFVGFLIATFISILDSIGDYYACAAICRVPPPPSFAVNRGIAIEGLCTVLSGVLGCPQATTTYGANIGAIGVTRVSSRSVFIVVGVVYIIFGVIGKLSAVFISIPYPVLGGALIIMMGMFNGVVLSNLVNVDLTSSRNLAIMGVSLLMGLLVPLWVKTYPNDIDTGNTEVDFILKGLLGNPNFSGAIIACFLDNTIPGTLEERGITAWQNNEGGESGATTNYVEGIELYDTWLPESMKNWKGLEYIPFMPTPKKRKRSLSGQWARRKSIIAGVSDVMV